MLIPLTAVGTQGPFSFGEPELSNRQLEQSERQMALAEYRIRRDYYAGEQYETENYSVAEQAGYLARGLRLPEHLRKHAVSEHVAESIDTLADMLAEGVAFEGPNAELLNEWWIEHAHMEDRVDDWFRESLMCGDTYAIPRYHVDTEEMEIQLWEAESIWPVYDRRYDWRRLDHWSRFIEYHDSDGRLVQEERLYTKGLVMDDATGAPITVVMESLYRDGTFVRTEPLSQGEFDLVHARGDSRERLRSAFGDTMITKKVRGHTDRYNALEQLAYRVTRQNSFSQVAVVGDGQFGLDVKRDEGLPKDVADVWRFPGGTNVTAISLPTDTAMIEHATKVLEKNLYRAFGLTKMDVEDIGGLGTVSGYALEVLSRKDRATHKRVRKNALAAIRDLGNKALDVYAVATEAQDGRWWEVDPREVFPDRSFRVVIGSGDIVDAVGDRDDYGVKIVSRRHVLRRKGLSAPEIEQIEQELAQEAEEAQARTDASLEQQALLEKEKAVEVARVQASLRPSGTQSGSTQRST